MVAKLTIFGQVCTISQRVLLIWLQRSFINLQMPGSLFCWRQVGDVPLQVSRMKHSHNRGSGSAVFVEVRLRFCVSHRRRKLTHEAGPGFEAMSHRPLSMFRQAG